MRKTVVIVILAGGMIAQQRSRQEIDLQAAIRTETVSGDLKGAIKQYAAIVAKYGKTDRAVAAMALLHMAEAYQKTGDAESRKIYEQLVKDYADQKDAVAQARMKLAAMGGPPGGKQGTERVAIDELAFEIGASSNVAMDQPLVPYTDRRTGDLMLWDLGTGEKRNLTRNLPDKQGKEFAQDRFISADGKMVIYGWDEGRSSPNEWSEIRSINTDGTGMRIHLRREIGAEHLWPLALSPDKKTAIVQLGDTLPNQFALLSLADNLLKPFDALSGGNTGSRPRFSPDGKQVVFQNQGSLFLSNADGSGMRSLLTKEQSSSNDRPNWTPDGKWIVFSSSRTGRRGIYAIPADGGNPRLLLDADARLLGFTREGSLYYVTEVIETDVDSVQLDPASLAVKGQPSRYIDTFPGGNRNPSFSPDGKWIAFLSSRNSGFVVVHPIAGGEEKVLPVGFTKIWFPDSKALLGRHVDNGQQVFERVEVAGGATTEIYRGAPLRLSNNPLLAPDGSAVVGIRCKPGDQYLPCDLVRYDLRTKSETVQALSEFGGSATFREIGLSPDGKWLAVIWNLRSESGVGLFVRPAAGGQFVKLARSTDTEGFSGGLGWTPDSRKIIYSVTGPDQNGLWNPLEMRAVPVGGGAPTVIPAKGNYPSMDPSGRLAYGVDSSRDEIWVARNLLPSN